MNRDAIDGTPIADVPDAEALAFYAWAEERVRAAYRIARHEGIHPEHALMRQPWLLVNAIRERFPRVGIVQGLGLISQIYTAQPELEAQATHTWKKTEATESLETRIDGFDRAAAPETET